MTMGLFLALDQQDVDAIATQADSDEWDFFWTSLGYVVRTLALSRAGKLGPRETVSPVIDPEYSAPHLTAPEPILASTDDAIQPAIPAESVKPNGVEPATLKQIVQVESEPVSVPVAVVEGGRRVVAPVAPPKPKRPKTGGRQAIDPAATIEAIRSSETLLEAATTLGISEAGIHYRLDAMARRGKLPDDILARRTILAKRAPKAKDKIELAQDAEAERTRQAAAEIKAREPADKAAAQAAAAAFAAKRAENAKAKADATWRERHPEAVSA